MNIAHVALALMLSLKHCHCHSQAESHKFGLHYTLRLGLYSVGLLNETCSQHAFYMYIYLHYSRPLLSLRGSIFACIKMNSYCILIIIGVFLMHRGKSRLSVCRPKFVSELYMLDYTILMLTNQQDEKIRKVVVDY